MVKRDYYSIRTGKRSDGSRYSLETTLRIFKSVYENFLARGYFQEFFGYYCIDEGPVPGKAGADVDIYILSKLNKANLWPINERCLNYSEDDLFDVIELLFDIISQPIGGTNHTYGNCGWHYSTFNKIIGQEEYVSRINEVIRFYDVGYELSSLGEIQHLPIIGTEVLLSETALSGDSKNVDSRITEAKRIYLQSRSSIPQKLSAIRMLVDVLEFLKPQMQTILTSADEKDLFHIANKFGIRHHNTIQESDYDKDIWLDWMFYYYLSTLNACIRLMERTTKTNL